MQTNIEQAFKDYLDIKNYITENSKKSAEELKKEVAKKALKKETEEEKVTVYFEEYGENSILSQDFIEATKKLYYYYLAYKDLIEIDESIVEEIKDFQIKTVFGIVGGKKEIIDKNLYNTYKNQYLEHYLRVKEQGSNNQEA